MNCTPDSETRTPRFLMRILKLAIMSWLLTGDGNEVMSVFYNVSCYPASFMDKAFCFAFMESSCIIIDIRQWFIGGVAVCMGKPR